MPFPILNSSIVPCLILTVASWPAYRFLRRQVRWSGIPISVRIFQFVVIHTVKVLASSIKQMFFGNSLAFSLIQWMLAILWNSAFSCVCLSFYLLPFTSLLFSLFVRPSQTTTLTSCIYFSLGRFWSPPPVQCREPPSHSFKSLIISKCKLVPYWERSIGPYHLSYKTFNMSLKKWPALKNYIHNSHVWHTDTQMEKSWETFCKTEKKRDF